MTCAQVQQSLASGAPLTAGEARHWEQCPKCRAAQNTLVELGRAIRGAGMAPSPNLAHRTQLLVRHHARMLRRRRRALWLLAGACALSGVYGFASLRLTWDLAERAARWAPGFAPPPWAVVAGLNVFPLLLAIVVAWAFGAWPANARAETEEFYG